MSFRFSQKHQCVIPGRLIYIAFKAVFNLRTFIDKICKNLYQQVLRIVKILYISVYIQRQLVTVKLQKLFKSLRVTRKVLVINCCCIHYSTNPFLRLVCRTIFRQNVSLCEYKNPLWIISYIFVFVNEQGGFSAICTINILLNRTVADLVTDRDVTCYTSAGDGFLQTEQKEHFFGQTTVSVYQNDDGMIGSYRNWNVLQKNKNLRGRLIPAAEVRCYHEQKEFG